MNNFSTLLNRNALATAISNEASGSFIELEFLEMERLEMDIYKTQQSLESTLRLRDMLESISAENYTPEVYRQLVHVALGGSSDTTLLDTVVSSFENQSLDDYTAEAEVKKQGFLKRVGHMLAALFKRLYTFIKELFTKKKVVVAKLEEQQTVVEAQAKTANYDMAALERIRAEARSAMANRSDSTPTTSTPPPPQLPARPNLVSPQLRIGYETGHKVKLGFLGKTLDESVRGANQLAAAGHEYVSEIEAAAKAMSNRSVESLVGKHSQIQNEITKYAKTTKLPSGVEIDADFYSGGPRINIYHAKDVEVEVNNLSSVPLRGLLDARAALIKVLGDDTTRLGSFKSLLDSIYPAFKQANEKTIEYGDKFGTPEWATKYQALWQVQEPIMRVYEAKLGFLNGVTRSPLGDMISPGIAEINRCIGLRS